MLSWDESITDLFSCYTLRQWLEKEVQRQNGWISGSLDINVFDKYSFISNKLFGMYFFLVSCILILRFPKLFAGSKGKHPSRVSRGGGEASLYRFEYFTCYLSVAANLHKLFETFCEMELILVLTGCNDLSNRQKGWWRGIIHFSMKFQAYLHSCAHSCYSMLYRQLTNWLRPGTVNRYSRKQSKNKVEARFVSLSSFIPIWSCNFLSLLEDLSFLVYWTIYAIFAPQFSCY